MKEHGTNGSSIDRRLVSVCRLFYEKQLSKTDIAEQLGISITHVNRLLREAERRGIVRIAIDPPRFEGLELSLREHLHLADSVVLPASFSDQTLRMELGIAAARYFDSHVQDGHRVGLGSGRTLFEMVTALPERPREVRLLPIAVAAEQDLTVNGIDANTVVNILWFKSRPKATASRLELFFPDETPESLKAKTEATLTKKVVETLRGEITDLDYYFFSCSHLRKDSRLAVLSELYYGSSSHLTAKGAVGDVLFNPIDRKGVRVGSSIGNLIFAIELNQLQRASSDPRRRAVLVAGGITKLDVIRAAANAKLFNVIVTDNETAEALLYRPEGSAR
jgi:DNA-binding transcriptional regulator LsrR (DeoR family)